MGTLFLVLVFLCLPAACIVGVGTIARLGYGWVKAGFNIGRSGFYIEAGARSPPRAPTRREPVAPGGSRAEGVGQAHLLRGAAVWREESGLADGEGVGEAHLSRRSTRSRKSG